MADWQAVAVQMLSAVSFLHTLGVVHRDIKPDNVMLRRPWIEMDDEREGEGDARGAQEGTPAAQTSERGLRAAPSLVLVDFGSATFVRGGRVLKGFEGTKFFAAPEMCGGKHAYGAKADVWSVGVCLMVLLAGIPASHELHATWRTLHDRKREGVAAGASTPLGGGAPSPPPPLPLPETALPQGATTIVKQLSKP